MAWLTVGWLTVGAWPAHAQPAADDQPESRPLFTWRASAEWLSTVRWLDPARTAINPGNTPLRLPQAWAQTELRPDGRLEVGSRLLFVVRPRLVASVRSVWSDGLPREDTSDASANWTEAYMNWRASNAVQLTYGLQNFQWGPAELLSPSNRLFHEVGVFRDPAYYVRGRHMVRLNASAGKEWSLVTLAELGDNGEGDFNAGDPFRRQAQSKLEYAAPSGGGYIGATVGVREGARAWLGEYGSLSLTQGLSAYVDATHARGSRAWYPEIRDDQPAIVRKAGRSDAWNTLAVAGLRYTFVNGVDLRGEFVHQDAGYSRSDGVLAARVVTTSPDRETLERYLAPGLELLGRRLGLFSIRAPDLPPARHLVLQGRYLRSFTDDSGVAFAGVTLETTDALVLFASATATHGARSAEFSRLVRRSVVAGALWTW